MADRLRSWVMGGSGVLALGACGALGLGTQGEGKQMLALSAGEQAPAARGRVTVEAGKDGQQTVKVEVEHMAPVGRAVPGALTYVVWLKPRGDGHPVNLGELVVNENAKGKLTAKTPYRDFDVFVTAESQRDIARVTTPTQNEMMRASIQVPRRAIR